jgi:hypothetical protein
LTGITIGAVPPEYWPTVPFRLSFAVYVVPSLFAVAVR